MNIELHFDLIDKCINKYKFDIPNDLVRDLRHDIILRLLTKPKPDGRYTDESWVMIVSTGMITNFRVREKRYVNDHIDNRPDVSIKYSSILLSIELNCNEEELKVARMLQAGYTYKDIADSFGKHRSWVYRINRSIERKLNEENSNERFA